MGEFDLIGRYLAPLSGEGAFDLKDDAACAFGQIVTKDLLVEGVHFRSDDSLELVARKALRVNMSDVISKGARPSSYMLGIVWPEGRGEADFAAFAKGLRAEQDLSEIRLLGGDTTRGTKLTISITMFGIVQPGGPVLRSGGAAGHRLFVTGTIGDGLLGLEAEPGTDEACSYLLPDIPMRAEENIACFASAALDISDGLIADARHLADRSGLRLVIEAEKIPLSHAGEKVRRQRLGDLLTAGDDYQALFLVPQNKLQELRAAWSEPVRLTAIGRAEEGKGVAVLDAAGNTVPFGKEGWDHFG